MARLPLAQPPRGSAFQSSNENNVAKTQGVCLNSDRLDIHRTVLCSFETAHFLPPDPFGFWYTHAMKDITLFGHFEALDMRVGRIVNVEDANTKKPTYRITVDFGSEIGTKVSCGAYRNYSKEVLMGKQIIAVVNFGVKQMGPEKSEILILGVPNEQGETIYLAPQAEVPLGVHVF